MSFKSQICVKMNKNGNGNANINHERRYGLITLTLQIYSKNITLTHIPNIYIFYLLSSLAIYVNYLLCPYPLNIRLTIKQLSLSYEPHMPLFFLAITEITKLVA